MSSNEADMFPPEHYEAIGRLVVACTRVDAAITELIRAATWMDASAALITVHHQQFTNKVDALKALLDHRSSQSSPLPPQLIDTIDRAKEAYDFRSRLVHAAWTVGDKGTSPVTEKVTARKKLTKSKQHTPTSKIREYAQLADEIADRLVTFAEAL